MALPPVGPNGTWFQQGGQWYEALDGTWVSAGYCINPTPFVAGVTADHSPADFETTLVTGGTLTVTLPAPLLDGGNLVANTGSGTVTVAPPTGASLTDLNGVVGNISLAQGQSARLRSDGSDWYQVQ